MAAFIKRITRQRLWLILGGCGLLALGAISVAMISRPVRDPAPVAGKPVPKEQRDERLKLARENERKIIQALQPKNTPSVVSFRKDGTQLTSFNVDLSSYGCFVFSPDSTQLALGKKGGQIEVRDILTGSVIRTLPGHEGGIWGLAYSPIANALVSLGGKWNSKEQKVIVWNLETSSPKREFEVAYAMSMDISPDGTRLFVDDAFRALWDLETGLQVFRLKYFNGYFKFAPDGASFAVSEENKITLFESHAGQVLKEIIPKKNAPPMHVAFSPDGNTLALAGREVVLPSTVLSGRPALACILLRNRLLVSEAARSRPILLLDPWLAQSLGLDRRFLSSRLPSLDRWRSRIVCVGRVSATTSRVQANSTLGPSHLPVGCKEQCVSENHNDGLVHPENSRSTTSVNANYLTFPQSLMVTLLEVYGNRRLPSP